MYIDDHKTLREGAGLSIASLVRATELDRGTIGRVEKHYCARKITLLKIVDALNALHYTKVKMPLDPNIVITEKSRYGRGLDIETPKLKI